jgi:hypothetical protein
MSSRLVFCGTHSVTVSRVGRLRVRGGRPLSSDTIHSHSAASCNPVDSGLMRKRWTLHKEDLRVSEELLFPNIPGGVDVLASVCRDGKPAYVPNDGAIRVDQLTELAALIGSIVRNDVRPRAHDSQIRNASPDEPLDEKFDSGRPPVHVVGQHLLEVGVVGEMIVVLRHSE